MHVLIRGLLDVLFPPRCQACGRLRRDPICPECRAGVLMVGPPLCAVCGQPFDPSAQGAPDCADCREAKGRPYSVARSAASYEGPLVPLIWEFKYGCQMVLAGPLGMVMVEALAAGAADLEPASLDVVCPVPLHRSRLHERGFNQSRLLAEPVAAAIGKPVAELLERTRPTRPQVDLPRESRAANVRGAFAARAEAEVTGRRVLLVDDLFTTGSTIGECVRALQRAGAAEVRVFTLARPVPLWRRPAVDARDAQEMQAV